VNFVVKGGINEGKIVDVVFEKLDVVGDCICLTELCGIERLVGRVDGVQAVSIIYPSKIDGLAVGFGVVGVGHDLCRFGGNEVRKTRKKRKRER